MNSTPSSTEILTTEAANPASARIDALSPLEIVRLMNLEDGTIAGAVKLEADAIARAIAVITDRLRSGGRLIYIGAGTSGRLGVLDASECPPTFNTPPELVIGLIAGGDSALRKAAEGVEDHPEAAVEDLKRVQLNEQDVVVGIATSGRTPYVVGALKYAREMRAYAIGLACNGGSALSQYADLMIAPVVGPEIISGSTRMKAGTATKMVLNMLSTGTMVQLGKTFGNLMVDLKATNSKLIARSRRIVAALTGLPEAQAEADLAACNGELKTAVVKVRRGVDAETARRLLTAAGGQLRRALDEATPIPPSSASRHPDPPPRQGPADLVIGLDAGGTKTSAWLAPAGDTADLPVLGRGAAGPGNPRAVGFPAAFREMKLAIEGAFADAGMPLRSVSAICISAAGAGRPDEQQRIRSWAGENALAELIVVTGDAEPVLAAVSPEQVGIALISGTGSFAWGRNAAGNSARAGGWGHLLGDEGSGYAIALAGLRAAARQSDGRADRGELLGAFLERLRLREPSQLIEAIYGGSLSRVQIAELADVVFSAAERDPAARKLLDDALAELSAMVVAIATRLELGLTELKLALAGGVFVAQGRFVQELAAHLGLRSEQMTAVSQPVEGAVVLARRCILERGAGTVEGGT